MIVLGRRGVHKAASLLRHGGVVAIPTDTVYGLAARLDRPEALEKIFAVKGRPASLALPVLAASVDQVVELVGSLPEVAIELSDLWWPGGLTMVVPAPPDLAAKVGSATNTVGVRVPSHPLAIKLLAKTGPLAVTSANRHGEEPCTSAAAVVDAFGDSGEVCAVLDGGPSSATASTVVAVDDDAMTPIRDGVISADLLEWFLERKGRNP